ncbi:MAG: hypothetical protein GYB31_03820 [Bacteroidetes bacterium]|nr:hypothetical protein [Bacteroidota bacterium]
MIRLILPIFAITLSMLFSACEEPVENSRINYFVSATEADNVDRMEFGFQFARARQTLDGEEAIRSVYVDSKPLVLYADGSNNAIYLGNSDIEKSLITGYDLEFSDGIIYFKDGSSSSLEVEGMAFAETFLKAQEGGVYSILFEIDTEASLNQTMDVLNPMVSVIIEE